MREWMKECRKKAKLTQEKLAEGLGWSNDKLGRIERNEEKITPEEVTKIGKAINLSDEEIGNVLFKEAKLEIDMGNLMPKTREEKRFEIETHVAGICLQKTKEGIKILIAKRLPGRALYGGKWECGGGQVKPGENFEEAVTRQMREELGIKVKILAVIGTYEIVSRKLPQRKIPGVKFLCELQDGVTNQKIKISQKEFSEYKWIKENEVAKIDFISGVKKDISDAIRIYKSSLIHN